MTREAALLNLVKALEERIDALEDIAETEQLGRVVGGTSLDEYEKAGGAMRAARRALRAATP